MNEIKLPPLPEPPFKAWMTNADANAYGEQCALAAIEADRQARGEPVAWMTEDGRVATSETKETSMPKVAQESFKIPLYTAPQPQQIPEGFKLVPIEPTEEMLKASAKSGGLGMDFYEHIGRVSLSYKAMLEAAPEANDSFMSHKAVKSNIYETRCYFEIKGI